MTSPAIATSNRMTITVLVGRFGVATVGLLLASVVTGVGAGAKFHGRLGTATTLAATILEIGEDPGMRASSSFVGIAAVASVTELAISGTDLVARRVSEFRNMSIAESDSGNSELDVDLIATTFGKVLSSGGTFIPDGVEISVRPEGVRGSGPIGVEFAVGVRSINEAQILSRAIGSGTVPKSQIGKGGWLSMDSLPFASAVDRRFAVKAMVASAR